MAQKVLAWNVLDGFGDAQRAGRLTDAVLRHQPDVAFFPEAASEGRLDSDEFMNAVSRFKAEGYDALAYAYDDTDGRNDRHGFLAIGKNVVSAWAMSLGSRRAASLRVHDAESDAFVRLYGVHLDDRLEQSRRAQAERLLGYFSINGGPTAIAGDFNSLYATDPQARKLQKAAPLARRMPTIDPGDWHRLGSAGKLLRAPQRIGSIASRLTQMADGGTMQLFREAGFTDADTEFSGTKGAYQLDRVLYSPELQLAAPLMIHDANGLSDHKALTVTLAVR